MAKTVDQIVAEQLGVLTLTIARLQAENDALKEHVAQLEAAKAKSPKRG